MKTQTQDEFLKKLNDMPKGHRMGLGGLLIFLAMIIEYYTGIFTFIGNCADWVDGWFKGLPETLRYLIMAGLVIYCIIGLIYNARKGKGE